MKYIFSKYSRVLQTKDNNGLILYNTKNGTQSHVFDCNIIDQVKKVVGMPINATELNENLLKNYCVSDNINETSKVISKIHDMQNDTSILHLIILPTLDCNFMCTYCYEQKEKGIISDEILNNLYLAIRDRYAKYLFKFLKIEWFGGEPMMAYDKLLNFTERVNSFCENNNIIYQHSMTTNGSLLNAEKMERLLAAKIEIFQITIDGMPETHDRYRLSRSGKPTWNIIMDNLRNIKLINKPFRIILRVNYNYEILDTLDKFIEYYSEIFKSDTRFELAFKAIGHWGGEDDSAVTVIPAEYHPFIMDELLKKCSEYGVIAHRHFHFSCGSELCYANKKSSYVIYVDGNVGKCTLEEAPDKASPFVIGNIHNGYFNIEDKKEVNWVRQDDEFDNYLKTNGCYDCIAFPFCCGTSCPARRIRFGLIFPNKCTPTKDSLDNIVYMNYEINKLCKEDKE